jgi:ACS family glucarate transporter-like MFS transporter
MVHWGWRVSLLFSALPALVIAVSWLGVREPHPAMEEAQRRAAREAAQGGAANVNLRTASFALLTLSYTLQGYVGYIFVTWFYLYLVQERHFGLGSREAVDVRVDSILPGRRSGSAACDLHPAR